MTTYGQVLFLRISSPFAGPRRSVDIRIVLDVSQDVPEELQSQIEEGKKEAFQMTYGDKGYLYAARGYGQKNTSGSYTPVLGKITILLYNSDYDKF